nr:hypothetical protein [Tanacetum cinerariifolium]
MTSGREITPPPGFSAIPITTTMFAATTPENTPMDYRASTSANLNPVISPAFVEANYEAFESFLRDRHREMRNTDLRTKLDYFNEDYDKERETEPRPEGRLLVEAPKGNEGQSVNLPPLLAVYLGRGENGQPLQSSLTSAYGGQTLPNNIEGNLPYNDTSLSHYAQPFISASLTLKLPYANSIGEPPYRGNSCPSPTGGAAPHTFANSNMPFQNGFTYPASMPTNSYPFYTQPMYAFSNVPVYTNPNLTGTVLNPVGSVTPFVPWIEDYPLPNGLKMTSHIGSYDGKGDPDNFLHLFEGAIRM